VSATDKIYMDALMRIADGSLFANLPEDAVEREDSAKKIFKRYAAKIHPDIRPGNSEAANAFIELQKQRDAALHKFEPFNLKTKKYVYAVNDLMHKGGMASIYSATVDGKPVILKVPHSSRDNDLMQAETTALKKFKFYEQLFESFYILDEHKKKKSVTAFKDVFGPYGFTLEEIKKEYPYGVDTRVMVFILNRILESLAIIHSEGLRHGAVTPNHVLINHANHNGILLDFTNAGAPGKLISSDKKCAAYFPPEFPAHGFSSDIYSAAKCAVMIVGGNPADNTIPGSLPLQIREFLNQALQPKPRSRFPDGLAAFDALQQAVSRAYGPKKFVPLEMPTRKR
jgi:serine/threonine protein kinase